MLPRAGRERQFFLWLAAIGIVAIGLRLAYAFLIIKWRWLPGDSLYFHWTAINFAEGKGFSFINPAAIAVRPSAEHPPLFTLLLAVACKLGVTGPDAHRAIGCLLGGGTTLLVGLLARKLAGIKAGLVAASITAVYVPLIENDAVLMSESLYALLIAVLLLQAVYLINKPTSRNFFLLGIAIGFATLTRAEAILFLPLLGLPLLLKQGTHRPRQLLLLCLAASLVLTPWTIRNWHQFHHFVPLSNNSGAALAGANCDDTYKHSQTAAGNALVGAWSFRCALAVSNPHTVPNEAERAAIKRRAAITYARHHIKSLPRVAAIRVLRTWGLYKPSQQVDHDTWFEGRDKTVQWIGFIMLWALATACLLLIFISQRRRLISLRNKLVLFYSPLILVLIASATTYGIPRFRVPADIALITLFAALLFRRDDPAALLPKNQPGEQPSDLQ